MIRRHTHNEIDKVAWDRCIASSPQGNSYALSWYLDVVSPGWEALIEDEYAFIFPLTWRKKYGIRYLFQPYFTQQLGLFSNQNNIDEKKINEFLSAIPPEFRLVEIQLNHQNELTHPDNFEKDHKVTHHLALSHTYEKLSAGYSENLQRNLKKGKNNRSGVSKQIPPEEIITLFRQNKGAAISNLRSADYDVFLKLMKVAGEKGLLESLGTYNDRKELIAGAIFLKSIHSYVFLFSATGNEAKETGAMSTIIDSFIRDHSNENLFLDFEGSMDKNLARFYKSFGSKEVVYLQIRRNNLPLLIRWLK